ncbi:MAG: hypothetical protein KME42_03655 [Tildeniella nuda ZEHNDER 1965/U140]|jgi:hypothetical protein|nr:hypothetical protein [Tildeniella nuda ZEHNDER 1965/U140]
MQRITLRSHVGSDGVLHLQVPDDLKDQDVSITIQPIPANLDRKLGVELGWPEGFFAETAGAFADDDSFVRQPQGEYEARVLLE